MYLRAFIPFVLHDAQANVLPRASKHYLCKIMHLPHYRAFASSSLKSFSFFVLFKCFYGKYFLKENNRCWWHSEIIICLPSASKCIHYFLKRWAIFQRHSEKTLSLGKISTVYTYFYGKLLYDESASIMCNMEPRC